MKYNYGTSYYPILPTVTTTFAAAATAKTSPSASPSKSHTLDQTTRRSWQHKPLTRPIPFQLATHQRAMEREIPEAPLQLYSSAYRKQLSPVKSQGQGKDRGKESTPSKQMSSLRATHLSKSPSPTKAPATNAATTTATSSPAKQPQQPSKPVADQIRKVSPVSRSDGISDTATSYLQSGMKDNAASTQVWRPERISEREITTTSVYHASQQLPSLNVVPSAKAASQKDVSFGSVSASYGLPDTSLPVQPSVISPLKQVSVTSPQRKQELVQPRSPYQDLEDKQKSLQLAIESQKQRLRQISSQNQEGEGKDMNAIGANSIPLPSLPSKGAITKSLSPPKATAKPQTTTSTGITVAPALTDTHEPQQKLKKSFTGAMKQHSNAQMHTAIPSINTSMHMTNKSNTVVSTGKKSVDEVLQEVLSGQLNVSQTNISPSHHLGVTIDDALSTFTSASDNSVVSDDTDYIPPLHVEYTPAFAETGSGAAGLSTTVLQETLYSRTGTPRTNTRTLETLPSPHSGQIRSHMQPVTRSASQSTAASTLSSASRSKPPRPPAVSATATATAMLPNALPAPTGGYYHMAQVEKDGGIVNRYSGKSEEKQFQQVGSIASATTTGNFDIPVSLFTSVPFPILNSASESAANSPTATDRSYTEERMDVSAHTMSFEHWMQSQQQSQVPSTDLNNANVATFSSKTVNNRVDLHATSASVASTASSVPPEGMDELLFQAMASDNVDILREHANQLDLYGQHGDLVTDNSMKIARAKRK